MARLHQVCNLRVGTPGLVGSAESLRKIEVRNAAAAAVQTVPYAVAPGQRVVTPSGLVLTEGQEVTLELLTGATTRDPDPNTGARTGTPRPVPAWRVLERLVWNCLVLEATGPTPPRAA